MERTLYRPLDSLTSEIRLLTIEAGNASDIICCRTTTASLQASPPPQYEALSYVWGDSTIKHTISVDGHPLRVTTSLQAALRRLRRPSLPTTIWADAICINQDDIAERNAQVLLMGEIYSRAGRVVVWLGQSDERMEQAIRWSKQYQTPPPDRESFEEHARWVKNAKLADDGFVSIFSHPYWSRMWTLQEYRLAKTEPVLMCCHDSFSATKAAEAREMIHRDYDNAMAALERAIRTFGIPEERMSEVDEVLDRRADQTTMMKTIDTVIHLDNIRSAQGDSSTFSQLLQLARLRLCHDPRDKAYALYSLFPRMNEVSPVDYSKPVKRVFLEVATHMVSSGDYAVALNSFALYTDRLLDSVYPSWTPDLTASIIGPPLLHYYHSVTLLSRKLIDADWTRPTMSPRGPQTLQLHCRAVGNINVVLPFGSEGIIALAQSLLGTLDAARARSPGAHRGLSRALMAHAVDAAVRALPAAEMERRLYDILRLGASGAAPEAWPGEAIVTTAHIVRLRGKTLFTTSTGCLGVVGAEAAVGDEVVVTGAVMWPMVLRKARLAAGGAGGTGRAFKLIGQAYVDGLMDDECEDPSLIQGVLSVNSVPVDIC